MIEESRGLTEKFVFTKKDGGAIVG